MTEAAAAAAEPETVEEAEAQVEEDQARGYRGVADERDRAEYALTTGPDSPNTLEASLEAKRADIDAQLDELHARAKERAGSAKSKAHTRKSSSSKES